VLVAITGNLQAYLKQPVPEAAPAEGVASVDNQTSASAPSPASEAFFARAGPETRRTHLAHQEGTCGGCIFSGWTIPSPVSQLRGCRMPFHRTMRVHNLVQEITCVHLLAKTAGDGPAPQ